MPPNIIVTCSRNKGTITYSLMQVKIHRCYRERKPKKWIKQINESHKQMVNLKLQSKKDFKHEKNCCFRYVQRSSPVSNWISDCTVWFNFHHVEFPCHQGWHILLLHWDLEIWFLHFPLADPSSVFHIWNINVVIN